MPVGERIARLQGVVDEFGGDKVVRMESLLSVVVAL